MGKDEETGESKFGFKDQAKAEETIKLLQEHDIQYQKLTVRGLLGRAKRVLSSKLHIRLQFEALFKTSTATQWLTSTDFSNNNKYNITAIYSTNY